MSQPRLATLTVMLFLLLCGSSSAQNPGPQFWRRASCEPFEPRTRLERLEQTYNQIVVKGFTRITTTEVRGVRVDAVEMRELGGAALRVKGIVIVLRETSERPSSDRAYIDLEEIDPLINAMDEFSKIDETATKLAGFEARYQTNGDLEMSVFRQTNRGTAVTLTSGICDRATQSLTLDELAKLKAMIVEAKARLAEIR